MGTRLTEARTFALAVLFECLKQTPFNNAPKRAPKMTMRKLNQAVQLEIYLDLWGLDETVGAVVRLSRDNHDRPTGYCCVSPESTIDSTHDFHAAVGPDDELIVTKISVGAKNILKAEAIHEFWLAYNEALPKLAQVARRFGPHHYAGARPEAGVYVHLPVTNDLDYGAIKEYVVYDEEGSTLALTVFRDDSSKSLNVTFNTNSVLRHTFGLTFDRELVAQLRLNSLKPSAAGLKLATAMLTALDQ